MGKKLYVGNLSYDTSEDTLKELFSEAGTVETVDIIKDRISGRSKGFAFIEMSTEEEAEEAIKKCDGKSVDGREIRVSEARAREDRPRRDRF